ncbi:MAG: Ppx/GppA family phosphatase [Myxococcales bacterium]|nr:Ppx/GppA family phosphatase [Myxococcales bacterium]
MPRFAAIDVGTNSVLLVVADRAEGGRFAPVVERAEITRLGRGVDRAKRLAPEAIEETLAAVQSFAEEARRLGAEGLVVSATSAARDASNGAEFLEAARQRAGVEVEIISGEAEAQLSFLSAEEDFGEGGTPLVVVDIGGGSTELIYGTREGVMGLRRSLDVGSVRLTERFVRSDPVSAEDRIRVEEHLRAAFGALPEPPAGFRMVGVAGTVTTLYAVLRGIEPYDASLVHRRSLALEQVRELAGRLCEARLSERRAMRGLQPKRADVIPAGAMILLAAMERLGARECLVSDRGVRWGLLMQKFGAGHAGG